MHHYSQPNFCADGCGESASVQTPCSARVRRDLPCIQRTRKGDDGRIINLAASRKRKSTQPPKIRLGQLLCVESYARLARLVVPKTPFVGVSLTRWQTHSRLALQSESSGFTARACGVRIFNGFTSNEAI